LDALRDWGHAKDYVRMQWVMLQQKAAEDYVIATGVKDSVRQFIHWNAKNLVSLCASRAEALTKWPLLTVSREIKRPPLKVGQTIVKIAPRNSRSTEVETLRGDPSKAKLGWTPEITVQKMCNEMVRSDLQEANRHALLKANSYEVNLSVE